MQTLRAGNSAPYYIGAERQINQLFQKKLYISIKSHGFGALKRPFWGAAGLRFRKVLLAPRYMQRNTDFSLCGLPLLWSCRISKTAHRWMNVHGVFWMCII